MKIGRLLSSVYTPRRILIRGPDPVGSFVLATPFFRELRKNLPNAYIVLCVKPTSYDLARECPYVDKVIVYETNRLSNVIKLKNENFDTVFLLSGSFESAAVCYFAGIKNRIGYPHNSRGFLLTEKIIDVGEKHYVDYILDILLQTGYQIDSKRLEIYNKEIQTKFDFVFDEHKPVVGITYVSVANDARRWPTQYVLQLSEELVKKGYKVVILGKTQEIIEIPKNQGNIINLVNKTNLDEFISIVKKLHVYISVATGGIHIATALGVKVIGLYVPGDEIGWSPYGSNAVVITKNVHCSPCNPHKMKYCRNNICMQLITPKEVIEYI
ncbi:MAG: glycosyltransferase family 9 protein [Endomicrobia bacterium]|nr:glycosyltransferase family 9 protein [Endomicrobiia bacterium]